MGYNQKQTFENDQPARQFLAVAAQIGVVASIVAAPFFYLPNQSTLLPVDVILGRESAAEFVEREGPAIAVLRAATELLPADTIVGYVGLWEAPQIETEVRLRYLGDYAEDDSHFLDNQLGTTSAEVLASLERLGIDSFIWDRTNIRPEDWRSTLLSTTFLRNHTRILAGDRDAYLFQVLPGNSKPWGVDALQNLLEDPNFDQVGKKRGPWTFEGLEEKEKPQRGVVSIRDERSIAQRVAVSGGRPYLLIASATCANPNNRAVLTLRWFDDQDADLGAASEEVMPGVEPSEQFLWHRAPDGATSAAAELSTFQGAKCDFDKAVLYDAS